MAREIQPRDPSEWPLELKRVQRIGLAAAIDGVHGDDWKNSVRTLANALALLLAVEDPRGEPESIELAWRLVERALKERRDAKKTAKR